MGKGIPKATNIYARNFNRLKDLKLDRIGITLKSSSYPFPPSIFSGEKKIFNFVLNIQKI